MIKRNRFRIGATSSSLVLIFLLITILANRGRTQTPAVKADAQTAAATFTTYCVGCHNAKLRTGGIVIDPASVNNLADRAETWEKVVHQLRAQSMPPIGMPRPNVATYTAVAGYLETQLDGVAKARPNPGELPHLHRLTRTEYQNSIRDLLGLENLPTELDFTLLLPADNSASGFDNIADLLFVSPAILERYVDTAHKISRLAVGDPAMPLMVNLYRTPTEQQQDSRVAGLPFGTRGGVGIDSYFPDGRGIRIPAGDGWFRAGSA
ncbi:MAG: DUF1587 domain-containing protein [Acidobacteriota bacterium]